MDKLQDTGGRENHGCAGLTVLKEATGLRLEVLKEIVQDRKKWRMLVIENTRNRERTKVK